MKKIAAYNSGNLKKQRFVVSRKILKNKGVTFEKDIKN
jgi:hypothetical protein